jgi:DNA-binding HxlR family transcriptional regulator
MTVKLGPPRSTHLSHSSRERMVSRHVYAEVPPRVEYELTERGHSRESVLWALWKWGARDQPTVAATGVP